MKEVRVARAALFERIQKNRDQHREIFEEAVRQYRIAVIAELDSMIADARLGRKIRRYISLIEPEDHTKDYDRVLDMLAMSVEAEIVLSEEEFSHYVRDEWHWKLQFLNSTARYSAVATSELEKGNWN